MNARPDDRPRLVLLHGAGTDPRAFTHWPADFPDHDVSAPNLQAGLDVATAGMDDYARAARDALTEPLSGPLSAPLGPPQPAVVCGWSMGGLIALMLAAPGGDTTALSAVLVIEPSLPSQLNGQHPEVPVRQGSYHPDDQYGPSPQGPPTRRESQRAADQRRRGISVPSLAVPLLVIAGQTYPVTRGVDVADLYAGVPHHLPRPAPHRPGAGPPTPTSHRDLAETQDPSAPLEPHGHAAQRALRNRWARLADRHVLAVPAPGDHPDHMPQFSGPPYQDYLPPELRPQTAEDHARLREQARQPKTYPPPRPGHGTVWVMPPHDDDSVWDSSWQDDDNRMSGCEGSYHQVRDWTEHQPAAAKVIYIAALGRHVDVDDAAWAQALRGEGDPAPAHFRE